MEPHASLLSSYFFKINFNIMLQYTPRSSQMSLFSGFPPKTLYAFLFSFYASSIPCPSYSA